jgi:Fur family ferric uptake transcriptional regulator
LNLELREEDAMPEVDAILERLGREGYRLTGPRRTVLEDVVGRAEPFTSAEVWEAMRVSAPGIGRATIFRTLDLLSKLGVLQRIHNDVEGGRCHTYLACGDQHHHHLICNSCGRVIDFHEEKGLDELVREVEKRTNFRVEGHRLELVGRCPSCR